MTHTEAKREIDLCWQGGRLLQRAFGPTTMVMPQFARRAIFAAEYDLATLTPRRCGEIARHALEVPRAVGCEVRPGRAYATVEVRVVVEHQR